MSDPNNIFGKKVERTTAALLQQLEAGLSEGFLSAEAEGAPNIRNIFGRKPCSRNGTDLSFLAGMASGGLRTAAFLSGSQLGANYNQLAALARQNLAVLVHHAPYPKDGKGRASGYGNLFDIGHTGCFQLLAANLQELVDMTIMGHKIAELALLPGICGMDDAYSLQEASVPEATTLRHFLGEPDEQITCPTPAQRLIFGKSRRRIPQWYSLDTPAMNDARKGQTGLNLEGAARERYFYHHLPAIIQQVMEQYSNVSGRPYSAIKKAGAERADYLLLVQGADFETAVAAALQAKAKVGVLSLSQLRPFPQEELAKWMASKKGISVLEEADSPNMGDSAVFKEVKAAARGLGKKAPALYSGSYAGPLSPSAASAAIDNMQRGGAQRERFWAGFDFTRSATGFPQHEVMLQSISREYPDIEKETLGIHSGETKEQGAKLHSLPFAIRRYQDQGPPYSRLSRFYHNTACFYQQGIKAELVADPFQALSLVPAATANFASPAEGAAQLPVFTPQNCTGCGACIAYCPHSALPGVAISVQSLIRAGMKIATGQGTPIPQLMGIERKLVKVAEDLIRKSDRDIKRVEDFLPEAFQLMAAQSQMEGEKLERAQEGLAILSTIIGRFPIAVTEPFFHQKQRQEKGVAQLFSITIDPNACTGCGLCSSVCQDGALLMAEPDPGLFQQMENNMNLWEQLPDTPSETINQLIREPGYDSFAATLLSRHFYLSLSGGATSEAGAPAKALVHWLTALLESVMQPKVEKQAKELEQQIEELAKNIHQHLSNALPKRDFQFSDTDSVSFGQDKLPLEEVIRQLDAEPQSQIVDAAALRRKANLLNDLKALLWAVREGPAGGGRARYGLLLAENEAMPWADDYPFNAFTSPVVWHWDGSAPERLLGLLNGQARHVLDAVRLLRRSTLEAKNKYRPELHDQEVGTLDWADLTEAEKELLPPALLLGDARLFSGQSHRVLAELLASGLPVKAIILDDAAVPAGGSAVACLAAAQTAWASAVTLQHTFLLKGNLAENPAGFEPLRDGLNRLEPALFHLLAPRPGQHTDEKAFWPKLSRLALQTRAFPSLYFDPDGQADYLASAINMEENPEPEADWVSTVLSYQEGETKKEQPYVLTYADWLFSLKAWQAYFQPFEPESGSPLPVAGYLSLDEKGQKGKVPTLFAVNEQGILEQYAVSPEVISATRQALRQWSSLRELAGLRSPFPQRAREELEKELTQKYEKEMAELKASYEAKFQEQEKVLMEEVRIKLRDKLLALSRKGQLLSSLKEEME